jgi:hypothetical protein
MVSVSVVTPAPGRSLWDLLLHHLLQHPLPLPPHVSMDKTSGASMQPSRGMDLSHRWRMAVPRRPLKEVAGSKGSIGQWAGGSGEGDGGLSFF